MGPSEYHNFAFLTHVFPYSRERRGDGAGRATREEPNPSQSANMNRGRFVYGILTDWAGAPVPTVRRILGTVHWGTILKFIDDVLFNKRLIRVGKPGKPTDVVRRDEDEEPESVVEEPQ